MSFRNNLTIVHHKITTLTHNKLYNFLKQLRVHTHTHTHTHKTAFVNNKHTLSMSRVRRKMVENRK